MKLLRRKIKSTGDTLQAGARGPLGRAALRRAGRPRAEPGAHPCLLVTPDELAELKKAVTGSERAKEAFGGMDFVTREEFDAVKTMAAKAREENEKLAARIAALEARNP